MSARKVADHTGNKGRSVGFNALTNQGAIMGVVNGLNGRSFSKEAPAPSRKSELGLFHS